MDKTQSSGPSPASIKVSESSAQALAVKVTTGTVVRDNRQLIKTIKALIAKGDHAKGKSEQFYIAAGQHLKTLKAEKPPLIKWEDYLGECGIEVGRRRADELIQIADGRTTVEEVRAGKAKSVGESRARLALRSAEPEVEETEESELEQDEQEAEPEEEEETPRSWREIAEDEKINFILRANEVMQAATYSGKIVDEDVIQAAIKASSAWSTLAQSMRDKQPRPNEPKLTVIDTDQIQEPCDDYATEEDCPEPPKRGKRSRKMVDTTVGEAVAEAFDELESLAEEVREAVDNSEAFAQTQRVQTLDEAANILESLERLSVPKRLAPIEVSITKMPSRPSRADRCDYAVNLLQKCSDALEAKKEDAEAQALVDQIQEAASEAGTADFPGMFG